MRKLFVFVFMLMPITCGAHSMHIGDTEIPFYSTQYTTPSMHVQIDNEIVHAPAVKKDIGNTLHVLYNNSVYSICRGAERKVGNHYFVGDCLVGADDGVYLESTGTQYIDTEYIPSSGGYRATGKIMFVGEQNSWSSVMGVFGENTHVAAKFGRYYDANTWTATFGADNQSSASWTINTNYNFDVSFIPANKYLKINNMTVISSNDVSQITQNNIFLFTYLRLSNGIWEPFMREAFNGRFYFVNVYDDYNVMTRQFVPVPAGLQIGDFTVPENGMWDIVEQKFYGNSGTGDFIYGADE